MIYQYVVVISVPAALSDRSHIWQLKNTKCLTDINALPGVAFISNVSRYQNLLFMGMF